MESFGPWLRQKVEASGRSKSDFARRVGVEAVTLRSWFNHPSPNLRPENFVNLARELGITQEQLRAKLDAGKPMDVDAMLTPGTPIGEHGEFIDSRGQMVDVHKPDRSLVRYIPIVNRIAAGAVLEYPGGIADNMLPVVVDRVDAFALWIDGDSMSPRYAHGDLVVFEKVDGPAAIRDGRDYAIQLDAMGRWESAFKRVHREKRKPNVLIGEPLNPHFKPPRIEIPLDRVHAVGRPIMIMMGRK